MTTRGAMSKVEVKKHGVILKPTKNAFESKAVLNPAVMQEGRNIHIYYRAIDKNGLSCLGYARLDGPTRVVERWKVPILKREFPYESMGVEDPRMVKIGETYYMTYVVHDGKNALTAYATSTDLIHFNKEAIISPFITYHEAHILFEQAKLKDAYYLFASYYEHGAGDNVYLWHKDVILFPKKIRGKYALLHRILPDIQIALFKNFEDLTNDYWRKHFSHLGRHVLLQNKHWFETRNIGGGAPPIETDAGWLVIYHAVDETNNGRIYRATAALLDKQNPHKVIGKLHEPLFSPEKKWEMRGFVSNVVFPTGTAVFDDTLYIYYGAADKYIAVASVSLSQLLQELQNPKRLHTYGKKKRK